MRRQEAAIQRLIAAIDASATAEGERAELVARKEALKDEAERLHNFQSAMIDKI
jgi:hypothetical protein